MIAINCDDAEPTTKKLKATQDCKKIYFDIIYNIIKSLNEQFAGIKEYTFVDLLDINKFDDFTKIFPHQHIKSLQENNPGLFDTNMLLNELKYLYVDSDFRKCKSVIGILVLIYKLEIESALSECKINAANSYYFCNFRVKLEKFFDTKSHSFIFTVYHGTGSIVSIGLYFN